MDRHPEWILDTNRSASLGCVWAGQAFRGHFGGVWALGRLVDVLGTFGGRLGDIFKCPRDVRRVSSGCPLGVWVSGCRRGGLGVSGTPEHTLVESRV